jgi:hypothetical protein
LRIFDCAHVDTLNGSAQHHGAFKFNPNLIAHPQAPPHRLTEQTESEDSDVLLETSAEHSLHRGSPSNDREHRQAGDVIITSNDEQGADNSREDKTEEDSSSVISRNAEQAVGMDSLADVGNVTGVDELEQSQLQDVDDNQELYVL